MVSSILYVTKGTLDVRMPTEFKRPSGFKNILLGPIIFVMFPLPCTYLLSSFTVKHLRCKLNLSGEKDEADSPKWKIVSSNDQ